MSYNNNMVRNYNKLVPYHSMLDFIVFYCYRRTINKIIWAIAKRIIPKAEKTIILVHRVRVFECWIRFADAKYPRNTFPHRFSSLGILTVLKYRMASLPSSNAFCISSLRFSLNGIFSPPYYLEKDYITVHGGKVNKEVGGDTGWWATRFRALAYYPGFRPHHEIKKDQ